MGLTAREDKFCNEYVLCLNATKAATLAGYSAKTARNIGSQNLAKLHIQNRIQELNDDLSAAIGVNRAILANELKKIALSTIADSRTSWMTLKDFKKLPEEVKAAIAEVHHETRGTGKTAVKMVKIKYHNKLTAIQTLNEMLGYNAPRKHEVTGKGGKPLQQEVKHVVEFNDYGADN